VNYDLDALERCSTVLEDEQIGERLDVHTQSRRKAFGSTEFGRDDSAPGVPN